MEGGDRLLAKENPAASDAIARAFDADGIDVRTGVTLAAIDPDRDGRRVAVLDDGSEIDIDLVLVAVGRRPGTSSLGLDAAGVTLTDTGHVDVDAHLRTSNPRIWAAGDLTGHPPFTHTAGVHGSLAASNAVLGLRRSVQPDLVPRVTYTSPEVAAFGVAAGDRPDLTVRTVPHSEVDRAVTEGHTHGYSQLVLDRRGKVVGARSWGRAPASASPRRCSRRSTGYVPLDGRRDARLPDLVGRRLEGRAGPGTRRPRGPAAAAGHPAARGRTPALDEPGLSPHARPAVTRGYGR